MIFVLQRRRFGKHVRLSSAWRATVNLTGASRGHRGSVASVVAPTGTAGGPAFVATCARIPTQMGLGTGSSPFPIGFPTQRPSPYSIFRYGEDRCGYPEQNAKWPKMD